MPSLLLLFALLIPVTSVFPACAPLPTATADPGNTNHPATPPGPDPGPPGDPARFTWPLPAPHPVVRPFVPPATPYGPGHRGVDLAGQPGSAVTAAGDGVVAHAGPVAGRGVVSIVHANGLRTTYEPVEAAVAAGTRVTRGEVIGHLARGHDGCVDTVVDTAACLHWGALRGDEYLDPLGLLTSGRVRLLPWKDPEEPEKD